MQLLHKLDYSLYVRPYSKGSEYNLAKHEYSFAGGNF